MSTMNTEALFLFLILLLGLVLCSFLGGTCNKEGMRNQNFDSYQSNGNRNRNDNFNPNPISSNGASTSSGNVYDNYNHYSGTSTQLANGTTFYGPNGGTIVVSTGSDGNQTLQVMLSSGQQSMSYNTTQSSSATGNNGSATTFYGPNNSSATIVNGDGGNQAIQIQTSSGSTTFTQSGSYSNPNNTTSSTQYYGSTGTPIQSSSNLAYQQGPYGGSAGSVTGPAGNTAYYAQGPAGNTVTGSTDANYPYNNASANQYYGPNGGSAGSVTGPAGNTAYYAQGPAGNTVTGSTDANYPYNNASANQYYGPNGGSAGSVTGPAGNTAYYAQGPAGNTVTGSSSGYGNQYYSSLPSGIPGSQIIPGQEDLYILKSEVVPPVCPACPTSSACPRQEPCPACPPCGRCPEPAFDCKKVPNYNAINNEYLPAPVLSDFSSFGM